MTPGYLFETHLPILTKEGELVKKAHNLPKTNRYKDLLILSITSFLVRCGRHTQHSYDPKLVENSMLVP